MVASRTAPPQYAEAHVATDCEQKEHNAEFRDVQQRFSVGDDAEHVRADEEGVANWDRPRCRHLHGVREVVYAPPIIAFLEVCHVNGKIICSAAVGALALGVAIAIAGGATRAAAQDADASGWPRTTSWGDPNLEGEWTTEGEYGVPFERPVEYGTRDFLTDEEYAKRLAAVEERDARDLKNVDVLAGPVEGANAPIPHWREYETDSRRTSLVVDPPNGRLPERTAQAAPLRAQQCGSLARGEPCDSYKDYGLGVRCIVHGGGFPDAMFPAVYNANFRIVQAPGVVAINYELIHDTRVIPVSSPSERAAAHVSPDIRMYMGDARGRWEGDTLVVETTNLKAATRGASPGLRLVERFTRVSKDLIEYRVTFEDSATWTAPWTAALDMKSRPGDAGVYEYACHEGNLGMRNMLSAARYQERVAGDK